MKEKWFVEEKVKELAFKNFWNVPDGKFLGGEQFKFNANEARKFVSSILNYNKKEEL